MSRISHPFSGRPFEFSRVIGEYSQSRPGPLLVVLAGLHGNEPSSLFAVTRVVEGLRDSDSPFQGHFCGLAGNMAALEQQRRYIDRDMNRIWAADRIEGLRNAQSTCAEENEMLQVVREIESRMRGERENFFLDCHTTSSATLPYISVPRHPRSVRLAAEFPLFTVLGAGDMLENTSDRYLIDRGFTGFAFEAGQHDALASIENHEAAIWVALQRVGCIAEVPRRFESTLAKDLVDGPRYFEVEYVHRIEPETGFRMCPGFFNFQRVRQGDLLAWENESPVLSQWDGRVFLPLYQELGQEGFIIISEMNHPVKAVQQQQAAAH